MTFYTKIISFTMGCLLVVGGAILYFLMGAQAQIVSDELSLNAQKDASLLAVSISKNIDLNDTASLNKSIKSVIAGKIESISIVDENHNTLVSLKDEIYAQDVPFMASFISVDDIRADANILKDNFTKGSVIVEVKKGYILKTFWDSFGYFFNAFLLFICISMLIFYFMSKALKRPLSVLSSQAHDIDNNKFKIQKQVPEEDEYKTITSAMNKTVTKLQGIYDREINIFRKYNRLLFTDDESKLGNRKYINLKLENYVKDSFGVFMFVEIKHRAELKHQLGYVKFKALTTFFASAVNDHFGYNKKIEVGKLNDETLAILLPYEERGDIAKTVERMYDDIQGYIDYTQLEDDVDIIFAIGISNYQEKESLSKLYTTTSLNLAKAFNQKDRRIYFSSDVKGYDKAQRKQMVKSLLKDGEVGFNKRRTFDFISGHTNMYELIPRLRVIGSEEDYSSRFIFGISSEEDRISMQKKILSELFSSVKIEAKKQNIAIALAKEFAEDSASVSWLLEELSTRFSGPKIRFYFECQNSKIHANKEAYIRLAKGLRRTEHKFAVNSFAFENNNFEHLKDLRPDHIKISKSYFMPDEGNISEDVLENISLALGAKLIINDVSTKEEFNKLNTLHVRYMQGEYINNLKDV